MVSPSKEATNVQSHERANSHNKLQAVQSDDGERPHKIRRLSDLQQASVTALVEDLTPEIPPSKPCSQLPSPSAAKTDDIHHKSSPANCAVPERKSRSPDRHTERASAKRARSPLEPSDSGAFIEKWLSSIPSEEYHVQDDMSPPPSKRSWVSDSSSRRLSQPGDGTASMVSADTECSGCKDMIYMCQDLLRQMEQQQKMCQDLLRQMEQQQKDAKDRVTMLVAQLEQQRKEHMQFLKQATEQVQRQNEQITQLLLKQ